MTEHIVIGDVSPRVQYTGDGAQTQFAYPFPIFEAADLEVWLADIRQEDGFTVSGAGASEGGSVSFDLPPAAGVVVTLRRHLPIRRTSDFQEGGDFRASVVNDEFDRQTAAAQQLEAALDRTVRLSVTDTAADMTLPAQAARTGRYLAFDANGRPVATAGTATDADVSDKTVLLPGNDEAETLANLLSDYSNIVNVRAFGATGDGATDDGQAIEDAVAALSAGDTLYFPPGTYNIAGSGLSGSIVFATGNVRVLGAGADRTSIVLTGTSGTGIFRWSDKSGVEVAGIAFTGDDSASGDGVAGSAIYISLPSAATADITDFHVHDCVFSNFNGAGWLRIDNQNATYDIARVRIERNRFSGGSDQSPATTIAANQIYFVTSSTGYIEDYWITDNHCDANSVKMGISLQARTRRGHISRNTVLNAGQANSGSGVVLAYGISVYNAGIQVTISDNVVINAYTCGFYILDPNGFTVTGNYVSGQEETSVSTLDRAGIVLIGGGNSAVSGNTVADCYRGIMLRPGADDAFTVTGNHIENCTFGLVLRVNALASYRGSVVSGNHIEGTATAVEFLRAGTNYWRAVAITGNRLKGAVGISGYPYFQETLIAQNLIHATTHGILGASNVLGNTEFGASTEFRDNVVYGDLSGFGIVLNNSGPDIRISGLTLRDISTGKGWRVAGTGGTPPGYVTAGVVFINVTTPTESTAGFDTGIEDPAGNWTTNLPENGTFVQKLVSTKDGNGRALIGWRLIGGTWEDEFVSTATWT